MGAVLKRDELLKTIQTAMVNTNIAPLYEDLNRAALWLERLPAGCELVGIKHERYGQYSQPVVCDPELKQTVFFFNHAHVQGCMNPDDLAKAGKR